MSRRLPFILIALMAVAAMAATSSVTGMFMDLRDGKKYKTVKIGNQTWMAENLNFKTQDSYCYEDNESKCSKYGRLYKWQVALKACPAGWHLPSEKEFGVPKKKVAMRRGIWGCVYMVLLNWITNQNIMLTLSAA